MQSPLNDAIRDVDAAFDGVPASNRQIAEEVRLRHPDVCAARADELMMGDLVRRVSQLRKKAQHQPDARDARQLELPEFVKHMLPQLPAKIPLYPEDGVEVDDDELPWQTIWRCTVDELGRYERMLAGQIRSDQKRHRIVRELLDAAVAGCGGDRSIAVVDAIAEVAA